jgi:hypothetical protein
MATVSPTDIQSYLDSNPSIIFDYVKSNMNTLLDTLEMNDIQQFADKITDGYPFNIVDTPAFTAIGIEFTPFLLAGLIVPILFITLLMVIMKNCYGSVFVFVWISVIVLWFAMNAILFSRNLAFQNQINLASKYVLLCISALFVILTTIGIVLRILSFPLGMLSAPTTPPAQSVYYPPVYYQPPAEAAAPAAAQPQPQQGGGASKKRYPRMIYVGRRATGSG